MQSFSTSPCAMWRSFHANRSLIRNLVVREITERYKGSLLGLGWAVVQPLFNITIYIFVFTFVFSSRWPGGSGSKAEFALILFAGLLILNVFSEMLNRAPQLILDKKNYVKRVVFPLDIMPFVCAGTALFNMLVSLALWFIFFGIAQGVPPITTLLLPAVLAPFVCFMLGITWLFSALGTYLRDLSQVTIIISTAAMFLTPVFYPPTIFPAKMRFILKFNPLTDVVQQLRDILIWSKLPGPIDYFAFVGLSLLVMWGGFAFFQRTRKGFADVV